MSISVFYTTVNIVLPVFIIILVGFFFGKIRRIDLHSINELILYITTPCLIISALSKFPLDIDETVRIFLCVFLLIILAMLVGILLTHLLKLPYKIYVPTLMFGNTGNMGLPLILFAFGQEGFNLGILYMVGTTIMHYTLGIIIINSYRKPLEVLKLPLIYATVAGILISTYNLTLPLPVERAVELLGDITIPAMIFSLGYKLSELKLVNIWFSWLFGFTKILGGFALGVVLVKLMGLQGTVAKVIILQSAMPPAVFNFVLAEKYKLDSKTVASVIMAGTILSVLFIPLVVTYLIQQ